MRAVYRLEGEEYPVQEGGRRRQITMSNSTKLLLGVAGGVLLLLALFVAFSGGGMMEGMDRMMGGPMMGGVFMVFWLIFLVAIIALIVWLVMHFLPNLRGGNRSEARGDSVEETLRQRFARGEIDVEEYERSLEVLRRESGAQSDRTDER